MIALRRFWVGLMAVFAASYSFAADAVPAQLQWPLSCSAGRDCFIKAYPDVTAWTDPSKPVDYRCGGRTEPGLAGTKVMFKDWATALDDQPIYPVAMGRVKEITDHFADGEVQPDEHSCGNRVVVDHGGWESTYCHLKQGSVKVAVGQNLVLNDVLGYAGQSGAVAEPMLAFYLTQGGLPFDPFLGQTIATTKPCVKAGHTGVWTTEVNYLDAAHISSGFGARVVNHLEVKANAGLPAREISAKSPYLVAWIRVQHVMQGDEEIFTLANPAGKVVQRRVQKLPGYSPDYLSYVLFKAGKDGLNKGDWLSHYELKRSGRIILQKNNTIHIE
jgi:hypothetical protein